MPPLPTMLQLLVFDARRGNTEGQEDDKVLAWFPPGLPPAHHTGLAGLLHGLLLFTANFTAVPGTQRPHLDLIETDSGTWVLLESEPHIWFGALAPRAWLPRHAGERNLRAVLTHMHLLTTVLCGSVQSMLDQDPEGSVARLSLTAVLRQAGRQLSSPHSWQHRELRNPLGDAALPPLLALPPGAALGVQSLCNLALQATLAGAQPVAGVMLLYGPHMLWSTLPPRDTAALFALLDTGLLHASSSSASGGGGGDGGGGGGGGGGIGGTSSEDDCVARADLRPLDGGAWQQLPSGFLVQRSSGTGTGSSGSSRRASHGAAAAPATSLPRVHLQHPPAGSHSPAAQAEQAAVAGLGLATGNGGMSKTSSSAGAGSPALHPHHLLPFLEGKLLLVLLLSGSTGQLSTPLLGGLHALLAAPAKQLAAQIGEDLKQGRIEAAHIPGFRYLFTDAQQQVVRASPRAKVSAMSHHARALAAAVRDSLGPAPCAGTAACTAHADVHSGALDGDAYSTEVAAPNGGQGAASLRGGSSSGSSGFGDYEVLQVMAKSSQDCWAAAWRPGDSRQLLAVRERRTERDPGEAAEVLQAFAEANFLI